MYYTGIKMHARSPNSPLFCMRVKNYTEEEEEKQHKKQQKKNDKKNEMCGVKGEIVANMFFEFAAVFACSRQHRTITLFGV